MKKNGFPVILVEELMFREGTKFSQNNTLKWNQSWDLNPSLINFRTYFLIHSYATFVILGKRPAEYLTSSQRMEGFVYYQLWWQQMISEETLCSCFSSILYSLPPRLTTQTHLPEFRIVNQ